MFKDLRKYTMPIGAGAFRPKADSDTCLQYDKIDADTASSCSIMSTERPSSAPSQQDLTLANPLGLDAALTFGSPGVMALAMKKAAVVSGAVEKKS